MAAAVAIIDSGGANIASLLFAFERLGVTAELSADARRIRRAARVVLPGVGAARDAMRRLEDRGLTAMVRELTQPVLGICLGMQLLGRSSEEDGVDCLGVLPGTARRLLARPGAPVPNMGWCPVRPRNGHALLDGIEDGAWFYFLHSYALPVDDLTVATATHGDAFAAMVARDNFFAAQFHPERSARSGARLLRNFLRWSP
jgi:glutamine amidotransferase